MLDEASILLWLTTSLTPSLIRCTPCTCTCNCNSSPPCFCLCSTSHTDHSNDQVMDNLPGCWLLEGGHAT